MSCEIPSVDLIEAFEAPPFQNTPAIEWIHTAPRFGHTNNVLLLMQGNEDEQRDYIMGLISSSIAVFCFFLLWVVLLIVFKCMGPYEAGFLSGEPRPLPSRPAANSSEYASWKRDADKQTRWLQVLRIIACFSGFAVVLGAILMATKGVNSLTRSIEDGRESVSISQGLANEALSLIDRSIEQNTATGEAVDGLLADINNICPTLRPNGICTDLDDLTTCDFDGIFDSDIVQSTLQHFSDAQDGIYYEELVGARSDLEQFLVLTASIEDNAKSFDWALYCSMVASILLATMCSLILFGLLCRNSSVLSCLKHWVLVPAVAFVVFFAFAFAIVFIMGSMAAADMCVDSPDNRILVILNRFRDQLTPLAVDFASFYINGKPPFRVSFCERPVDFSLSHTTILECPADSIPQEFSTQIDFVLDTVPTLGNFSSLVAESSGAIQVVCGFNDASRLASVANTANEELCDIVQILDDIRLFFQCENWFPLYESTMYNTVCYDGTDGFAWIA